MNLISPKTKDNSILQEYRVRMWKYLRLSDFFTDLTELLFYGKNFPEHKLNISYKPIPMIGDFSKMVGNVASDFNTINLEHMYQKGRKLLITEEAMSINSDIDLIFKFIKDSRAIAMIGGYGKISNLTNIVGSKAPRGGSVQVGYDGNSNQSIGLPPVVRSITSHNSPRLINIKYSMSNSNNESTNNLSGKRLGENPIEEEEGEDPNLKRSSQRLSVIVEKGNKAPTLVDLGGPHKTDANAKTRFQKKSTVVVNNESTPTKCMPLVQTIINKNESKTFVPHDAIKHIAPFANIGNNKPSLANFRTVNSNIGFGDCDNSNKQQPIGGVSLNNMDNEANYKFGDTSRSPIQQIPGGVQLNYNFYDETGRKESDDHVMPLTKSPGHTPVTLKKQFTKDKDYQNIFDSPKEKAETEKKATNNNIKDKSVIGSNDNNQSQSRLGYGRSAITGGNPAKELSKVHGIITNF